MLKKTMTYTNFNGEQVTEDFYFNLTQAEVAELELGITGGMSAMLKRAANINNTPELMTLFKDFILKSYGVKSPDGRRFIKNDEVRNDFAQTQAYSDLFMELASDDVAAANFFNAILPAEMAGATPADAPSAN